MTAFHYGQLQKACQNVKRAFFSETAEKACEKNVMARKPR
ncbi:Hypothetical protein ABZS17I87_02319 [Kosakonia cowanii]